MNMPDSVEILTPEQFSDRMQIGRTTFFEWKKKGKLQAGRDFIKEGRVIRILWCAELLKRLLESSNEKKTQEGSSRTKREKSSVQMPKRKVAINLDY
jgi:hypothetical protein